MMNCCILAPDLTVKEVLSRWPQTIPVFNRHRTACVGCSMAAYDTLADVATIYQLSQDGFLYELHQAICQQGRVEEE
jgi:hybrid cluster-associated redox disulfide protein